MPCYRPLVGYRALRRNANGKRNIVFRPSEGFRDMPVKLPCGQCVGCRLERSRQWAVRCEKEAELHSDNCFITLTYRDEDLPEHGSLVKKHFQDFMKRLRSRLEYYGRNLREDPILYLMCGEYGERFQRAHYHACIFGLDFSDRKFWKRHNGFNYYRSEVLEDLWPHGFSITADFSFETAAYVARYVTKKVTGKNAFAHYTDFCPYTGEVFAEVLPEYQEASRGRAVGRAWLEKFATDVYPHDFVVTNGKKCRPPRYFDYRFELAFPSDFATIKSKRVATAKLHSDDNTLGRLRDREFIQEARAKLLKRGYESEP